MKKKIIIISILFILLFGVSACGKKNNEDALKFKKEYESVNNKKGKSGKENREVTINENNPFVYLSQKELIKKIENKDTFYVYFGDELCPWCRSAVEMAIEIANKNDVDIIYYVDIWDEKGNEIFRDKYELDENNKLKKIVEGKKEYYKVIKTFENVLSDYTLTTNKGKKISVGEKRIFAPNYIYVKDGKAVKLEEGTSDKQKDAYENLTDEMLKEEKEKFEKFFNANK